QDRRDTGIAQHPEGGVLGPVVSLLGAGHERGLHFARQRVGATDVRRRHRGAAVIAAHGPVVGGGAAHVGIAGLVSVDRNERVGVGLLGDADAGLEVVVHAAVWRRIHVGAAGHHYPDALGL